MTKVVERFYLKSNNLGTRTGFDLGTDTHSSLGTDPELNFVLEQEKRIL